MMWALIIDNLVVETTDVDPNGRFHPDLIWVECPPDVQQRWTYDGEVFSPPPAEEIPEQQAEPITRRQLRLTLVRNGISLETVDAAIASMPDGIEKQEAQIEWADASTFNRDHPTLLLIAAALGLTEAQIDAMWAEAVTA